MTTLDELFLELFEPDELLRWLNALDEKLPRSVNRNQTPEGFAFDVRQLLKRRGLLGLKTWKSLADRAGVRSEEVWKVAATFGVYPRPSTRDEEDEPNSTRPDEWGEAEDRAVRSAVEGKDLERLRVLLEELLTAWLAARGADALDPNVVQSLKAEVPALMGRGDDLEAVWGDVRYKPIEWLDTALQRSRCVARIGRDAQSGVGTGFRFPGEWLGPEWAEVPLVLTNAHVVTPDSKLRSKLKDDGYVVLAPGEAHVTFFGIDGMPAAEGPVARCLWSSPPKELDVTLLQLGFSLDLIPAPPLYQGKSLSQVRRINVIGHPNGGKKQLSLQENTVRHDLNTSTRLFYRSPTDGGSSGSPLFDNEGWAVVGIHHAAEAQSKVNRGIPLTAILRGVQAAKLKPPSDSKPDPIGSSTTEHNEDTVPDTAEAMKAPRSEDPMEAWFEGKSLDFRRKDTREAEAVIGRMLSTRRDVKRFAQNVGLDPEALEGSGRELVRDLMQQAFDADALEKLLEELLDDPNKAKHHDDLKALMASSGDQAENPR